MDLVFMVFKLILSNLIDLLLEFLRFNSNFIRIDFTLQLSSTVVVLVDLLKFIFMFSKIKFFLIRNS